MSPYSKDIFTYSRVLEDPDWYGNCPDGQRECTTGNDDDQLCVCGVSRVETEMELSLWYRM